MFFCCCCFFVINRAYRIGQCKDVTVFRLISLGTVEEIIYLRQIYKQQLQSSVIGRENARRYFEAVQGAEGQAGELFGIRNLFRLQTDGTCLTHRILEREGRIEVGIKTASTQATEERMRVPDPGPLSGDAASAEQTGSSAGTRSTSARHTDAGVLDFSSASEDEDPCSSRSKATDPNTGDEPGAGTGCGNMGLSALLQKHAAHRAQRGSDSSDESEPEGNWEGWDPEEPQAAEKKGAQAGWALSSDSEEERGKAPGKRAHSFSAKPADDHAVDHHVDMEDSEDLNVPQKANTKAQQNQKHKKFTVKRREEEIESFTSSEDEAPMRKMSKSKTSVSHASSAHCKKRVLGPPLSTQSTARKSVKSPTTQPRHSTSNSTGTIDTLLGGLQEVSYTHSNQKVVGSSRTENCLSRAALRDVFELNKHSQLPANHLLDISQTQSGNTQLSDHIPTDGGGKDQKQANHDRPHLQHQVSHSIRTSHHTQNATISVGETPSGVCKQQMVEMARFFGVKSLQEFAEELVSSTSAQRLTKLREFYTHRNPELRELIEQTFPKPKTEPKPPVTPASTTPTASTQRSTSKRSLSDSALRPLHEEEEAEEEEERKSREPVKKKRVFNADSVLDPHYRSNGQTRLGRKSRILSPEPSRNTGELPHSPPGTDVQPQNDILTRTERNPGLAPSPQVRRPSEDKPSTSSDLPSSSRAAETDNSQPTKNLITDLIGDTSILDDLFKPKRSADRPKPAPAPVPSLTERTKNRGKDFWDILNEGNEESINKLTDLTQVEKFCRSVSVSGRSKSESSLESSQLWKKNEKFLWKR